MQGKYMSVHASSLIACIFRLIAAQIEGIQQGFPLLYPLFPFHQSVGNVNVVNERVTDIELGYTGKNLTTRIASLSTSCVRTACPKVSTSLEQLVDNLQQA